jgi:hypothetical protein
MDKRYEQVLARFRRHLRSGRVFVHRGSSSGVCDNFSDDSFDWVYIDGNHLYEFVKSDLELYYHKVRSGGYIAGDDYKIGGWWKSGVKLAVDEFLKNRAVEVVDIQDGQFILRKPARTNKVIESTSVTQGDQSPHCKCERASNANPESERPGCTQQAGAASGG